MSDACHCYHVYLSGELGLSPTLTRNKPHPALNGSDEKPSVHHMTLPMSIKHLCSLRLPLMPRLSSLANVLAVYAYLQEAQHTTR